ncbi:MAG: kelch repeat-containing protein [Rhodothermales bacterium]
MPTARLGLATCAVNGNIYAIGGYPAATVHGIGTVEMYDPATDAWTTKSPMPTERRWLVCGVVGGTIYAIGGFPTDGEPALNTVESYDVASDTWTTRAPMLTPRKAPAATVVDGKIYVMGGANADEDIVASVEMYDPATDSWSARAPMAGARAMLASGTVDGKIYAIGGPGPGVQGYNTVEEYDPELDSWVAKTAMPTGRWGVSATAVNGIIYAIGGANGFTALSTVEAYDPATDTWTEKRSIGSVDEPGDGARWAFGIATVDEKVYVIGGALRPAMPPHPGTTRVQEYTPPTVATGVETPSKELADNQGTGLGQNFPNPFLRFTNLRFRLDKAQHVRLVVHDVLGRPLQVLVDAWLEAGPHAAVFTPGNLPSGMYVYTLETTGRRIDGRMQLTK